MRHTHRESLVFLLLVVFFPAGARAEIPVKDAIDLFDSATRAIFSFDIHIRMSLRGLTKEEKDSDTSVSRLVPLAATDQPAVSDFLSHQLFSHGKRRIELLDPASGSIKSLVVFNGETARTLEPANKVGMIRPNPATLTTEGLDYLTFYRNEYGNCPLVNLLRSRKTTHLLPASDGSADLILEAPPEPNTDFPIWGFRLRLDPGHGLLPKLTERFVLSGGKQVLIRQSKVTDWVQLNDGIWVPLKMSTTFFGNNSDDEPYFPISETETEVDFAKSHWNCSLAEDQFLLPFPVGTRITDETRRVSFVTGAQDPGDNLELLARDAREVVQLFPRDSAANAPLPAKKRATWSRAVILIGGLLVLASLVWYRKRKTVQPS